MPDRDRVQAHERKKVRVLRSALDLSSERIRPVADDEPLAELGACLHREQHRPVERVVPGSDVRHVEDERVEVGEVLRPRLQALERCAVERDDRKPRLAMGRRGHPLHVNGSAVHAVLGAEEPGEARVPQVRERPPGGRSVRRQAGRVRHEADPLSRDSGRIGSQRVDAEHRCAVAADQGPAVPEPGRGCSGCSPRTRPSACGRRSATARRQSAAPPGDPGSARTIVRPRTPATWRER